MNNDVVKVNWKIAMRKIKQQWQDSNEDEINQIQNFFEERERKLRKHLRTQKAQAQIKN